MEGGGGGLIAHNVHVDIDTLTSVKPAKTEKINGWFYCCCVGIDE